MDRCEKLRDNLYGAELLTGSILSLIHIFFQANVPV